MGSLQVQLKWFNYGNVSLGLSKITQKNIFRLPTQWKRQTELIFCRSILVNSRQVQFKRGSSVVIFHWVVWVKLLQQIGKKKKQRTEHRILSSFYRKTPLGGLHVELENGSAAVIYLSVIWVKLLKNIFLKPIHSEEVSDWADSLEKYTHGQSSGTRLKMFQLWLFFFSYLSKICSQIYSVCPYPISYLSKNYSKIYSVGPYTVKKKRIGLIFYRNTRKDTSGPVQK